MNWDNTIFSMSSVSNIIPCGFQISNGFLHIMWIGYSMNLVCLVWWYKPMLTLTFPSRIQKKHHHSLNLLYYHPSVVVSFYPQFCLFLLKLMDNILQKQQNSFVLLSSFLNFVQIFYVQMCYKIYKNVCQGNAHTFNDKRKLEDNFS